MLDQHQQGSEEMASRMALRYRDAPEAWGDEKDHRTWWVFLKREAFSDATHNISGLRNKHYPMPSAGPYEVSRIWDAGLHFSIVLPHKMQLRREINSISTTVVDQASDVHCCDWKSLSSVLTVNLLHPHQSNQ
jgi:hypothetical protein